MTLFVSEEFSVVEYGVCSSEDYEMSHRTVGKDIQTGGTVFCCSVTRKKHIKTM